MKLYSIIIPIYNEVMTLNRLLIGLKTYYDLKHEIIIVDDGSTDRSNIILEKCHFIKLIILKKNSGKGVAIKNGILKSKYSSIIIYDGDLELKTKDISKLMILDKNSGITNVLGFRSILSNPFKSKIEWGNFIFTFFFNMLFKTSHKDILCCAKAFYKKDIPIKKIKSKGFDIDVELSSMMTINSRGKKLKQIYFDYSRRSIKEGKKLKIYDGWIILARIIKMTVYR